MRLPDWLDVALEGGVLELQRALVRYRGLRRLLTRDWRSHAREVAEQCAALARCEEAVLGALDKALRRAKYDPNAGAAAHLAIAVERERRKATWLLARECGGEASLSELLAHLEDLARDECHLESAWLRFQAERVALSVVALGGLAALPLGSWLYASYGGAIPTLVSLDALREIHVGATVLVSALLLLACRLRLGAWSWLGVRFPVLPSGAGSIVYTAIGVTVVGALITHSVPVTIAAIAELAIIAFLLLRALWLVPGGPLLAPLHPSD